MGDLEYVAVRVAHHGSPVAVWSVEWWFHARRADGDCSVIDAVGVIDIDVEKRWERLTLAD
jgi:hypothetical protein